MQQYGAKLLQGLGYLRRFGCLPEGVLPAGQIGSVLVFLFGVIVVDAGKEANHPSIQVSKYPGAELDPRAVPDSYDAVCCADPPPVQLLRAPYVHSPRVPSGACQDTLLGSISHGACRMRFLGVLLIIDPW